MLLGYIAEPLEPYSRVELRTWADTMKQSIDAIDQVVGKTLEHILYCLIMTALASPRQPSRNIDHSIPRAPPLNFSASMSRSPSSLTGAFFVSSASSLAVKRNSWEIEEEKKLLEKIATDIEDCDWEELLERIQQLTRSERALERAISKSIRRVFSTWTMVYSGSNTAHTST